AIYNAGLNLNAKSLIRFVMVNGDGQVNGLIVVHKILKTHDIMGVWEKKVDMVCAFCKFVPDSHNHLFLSVIILKRRVRGIATLGYWGYLTMWRILHLEVFVGETNGPVKLKEMRRFVLGDDLERMMDAFDTPDLGENSHIRRAGGDVLHTELYETHSEDNKVIFPDFQPKQGVKIDTNQNVTNLSSASINYSAVIDELIKKLESRRKILSSGYVMKPIQFEKALKRLLAEALKSWLAEIIIVSYSSEMDTLRINAPHIDSLTIKGNFDLKAILLLNMSSVIQAQLDYSNTKVFYAMEMHEHHQMNEELFKGLILRLSHVKELKVGKYCLEVLASLKTKGFICPSNMKVCEEIDSN
nr:ubiquitin-activating enzyme E1 1-like isoform X2 [Tanacetum cinerariifolium]